MLETELKKSIDLVNYIHNMNLKQEEITSRMSDLNRKMQHDYELLQKLDQKYCTNFNYLN